MIWNRSFFFSVCFYVFNYVSRSCCIELNRVYSDLTIYFSEVGPIESMSKTTRTIKHGARFSRKLQKRLTQRTLIEARALKEQGTECIHVLLYVAELVRVDFQSIFDQFIYLSIHVIISRNFRICTHLNIW